METLSWRIAMCVIALSLVTFQVVAHEPAGNKASHGKHASAQDHHQAIVAVMKSTWERPDAPLDLVPIVVRDDHAVVGWIQGDMGGRALLRQNHGKWDVVLCSGDALTEKAFLQKYGLRADAAGRLAQSVIEAEKAMPADKRVLLSRFDGVVLMNPDGSHPPAGHGQHGGGKH